MAAIVAVNPALCPVPANLYGTMTGFRSASRDGPDGGIGRRRGLKIPRRKVCRFESGLGDQPSPDGSGARIAELLNELSRKAPQAGAFLRLHAAPMGSQSFT